MDGYQYEHHCAKLLKQRGFRDVAVTKSSGDQGIDVIAYNENVIPTLLAIRLFNKRMPEQNFTIAM